MREFDLALFLSDERVLAQMANPAPFWLWSSNGSTVYLANNAATRMMGAVGEVIIGERPYSPLHPFAAQIKQLDNASDFITLKGVGKAALESREFQTEILNINGHEARLIKPLETELSLEATIHFIQNFPSTALLYSESGELLASSRMASSLAPLGFEGLLGEFPQKTLNALATHNKAEAILSTGMMKFFPLLEIEAVLCMLFEVKPKLAPKKEKPKLESVPTTLNLEKSKRAEAILDQVIELIPPTRQVFEKPRLVIVEETVTSTPKEMPKKETSFITVKNENKDFLISGTMPSRPQKAHLAQKKLRFTWASDENNILTNVSHELAECVGESSAEIIGKSWEELLKSLIHDKESSIERALTRRDTWSGQSVEWRILDEAGLFALVDIAALPVIDRAKGFQGYRGFGMIRDYKGKVTEQANPDVVNDLEFRPIKAPPALNANEITNFQEIAKKLGVKTSDKPRINAKAITNLPPSLMDDLPFGLVIYRGNDIFHVNQPFLKLTGFENRDEFEKMGGTARLFASRHLQEEDAPYQTLTLRNGEEKAFDIRLVKTTWQDESALALLIEQPKMVASSSPLENEILKIIPFPALKCDGEGKILSINHQALVLFEATEKSALNKSFINFLAPECHKVAKDFIDKRIDNGIPSLVDEGIELLTQTKRGKLTPIFLHLHRLKEDELIAVISNQSRNKEREETLQAKIDLLETKESQLSNFIAGLSHELRTPLNAVIGFAETMAQEHLGKLTPPVYLGYANDIHTAGTHILSLVNDMLDLAKLESGNMPLHFEPLDINAIADTALNMISEIASKRKVILRKSLTRPLPPILVDERALKQALLNLLANAIKFTPEGGQVVLSTLVTDAQTIAIRVRDTGLGMSNEQIRIALEPYGQPHSDRQGTGLGLPLTKALVEAQHASFAIASEPNQGTLVEITFPHNRIIT